jgi:glutamine amidotransferase
MITIIDYQMGNLRSVQKALQHVGATAEISSDPEVIGNADKIVLPGVGAFGDAMTELRTRNLIEPIQAFVASGKPFLGVCLGLQLLFDASEEGGQHVGLGLIPGRVLRFKGLPSDMKVPHMGWNTIEIVRSAPLLAGVDNESYFYFVHSYYVVPDSDDVVAAQTTYGGPFCAMVWRDNLFATQFHPEKSQAVGLQLLANFAAL